MKVEWSKIIVCYIELVLFEILKLDWINFYILVVEDIFFAIAHMKVIKDFFLLSNKIKFASTRKNCLGKCQLKIWDLRGEKFKWHYNTQLPTYVSEMEITHFVKKHFVEILKDDQKTISTITLSKLLFLLITMLKITLYLRVRMSKISFNLFKMIFNIVIVKAIFPTKCHSTKWPPLIWNDEFWQ